jgi:hypothetical protein
MSSASCKEMRVQLTFRGAFMTLTGAGLVIIAACSLDSTAPFVPCTKFGTLAIGDSISDSLVASSCRDRDQTYQNLYRFQLASQTKLHVTLSSPAAAAWLHVSDTTGSLIVNSTLSFSVDTNAIVNMILKAGTYYLGVNSLNQTPSGRFRVATAVDNSPVAGCDPEDVIWLTTGISTNQTITAADCTGSPLGAKYYYQRYRLVILPQLLLAFTEHSTALVPQVTLISYVGGGVLGTSSLDSSGTNARVSFTPSALDVYLLLVGSRDSLQVGAYSLTIQ